MSAFGVEFFVAKGVEMHTVSYTKSSARGSCHWKMKLCPPLSSIPSSYHFLLLSFSCSCSCCCIVFSLSVLLLAGLFGGRPLPLTHPHTSPPVSLFSWFVLFTPERSYSSDPTSSRLTVRRPSACPSTSSCYREPYVAAPHPSSTHFFHIQFHKTAAPTVINFYWIEMIVAYI